jgi:hypothetical protein
MHEFDSLEPAIDPNNRISFLLDWEITLKCNLDCSYCMTGLWGGHDNSTQHPSLESCLRSIDFMFEYVDVYMQHKPSGIRYVILNLYGGESLHHPNIVEILQAIRDKYLPYRDKWHLTVTTTTNAIVPAKRLAEIIPLIDEFTVSYHVENNQKQKDLFKSNLLAIAQAGKRQKCVVLMHDEPALFDQCQEMIAWLEQHAIKLLPRQLDGATGAPSGRRVYTEQQVKWFGNLYSEKSHNVPVDMPNSKEGTSLTDVGRACCGGRQVCTDQNYKSRSFFVQNTFPDWHCSVNYFFLYIKQITGDLFVNKDCKMNFDGQVGPIGNVNNASEMIQDLRRKLDAKSLPVIQCKKTRCRCGLCAPKARDLQTYDQIMEKYFI